MTQDDRMETIAAETDNPTVCITHGRFIPCRNEDWHHFTDNPYWVKSVRDFQGSDDPNLTWEPATLTITDPAAIRATDEPDERGDFPCCADRAHKESLGGDSESGTYNRSNRPPAGPCTDERTTPAPSSGAGPDLDAVEAEFLRQCGGCDAGLMVGCTCSQRDFRPTMLALVAEVRRLTARSLAAESVILDQRRMSADHDAFCRPATDRLVARAESAEAEVVTLRAKVAEVEALADQWADRKRSDGMSGNAWIGLTLSGVAADLRAALATTGEGQ